MKKSDDPMRTIAPAYCSSLRMMTAGSSTSADLEGHFACHFVAVGRGRGPHDLVGSIGQRALWRTGDGLAVLGDGRLRRYFHAAMLRHGELEFGEGRYELFVEGQGDDLRRGRDGGVGRRIGAHEVRMRPSRAGSDEGRCSRKGGKSEKAGLHWGLRQGVCERLRISARQPLKLAAAPAPGVNEFPT